MPHLARPAFNLGLAERIRGRYEEAAGLFVSAARNAAGTASEAEVRAAVREQLGVLTAFGSDVCERSPYRPYCF
ncbi:MAG TPA: hypothetical protein VJ777_07870 [Mycobacterium sp.]|nr:hypothetical protein [Mycobacterium sp.]